MRPVEECANIELKVRDGIAFGASEPAKVVAHLRRPPNFHPVECQAVLAKVSQLICIPKTRHSRLVAMLTDSDCGQRAIAARNMAAR